MLDGISIRKKVLTVGAIPALGTVLLVALVAWTVRRGTASVGVWLTASEIAAIGIALTSAFLTLRAALSLERVIARQKDEILQLKQVLEQLQHGKVAATAPTRARGRRDAFNEILLGLEEQARQVQIDRENLEQLVVQRTLALQRRNEAMRLVLDNVGQGLATIEPNGMLSPERSRVFDEWFAPGSETVGGFEQQLAKDNADVRANLSTAWEQVVEGVLPLELALDQMPTRLEVGDRSYGLEYRPIFEEHSLHGVLLVVTDLTERRQQLGRDAEQRELIEVFERFVHDRGGFLQFFQECDVLVTSLVGAEPRSTPEVLRSVHTLKGNCAFFGVTSVAEIAHELESTLLEVGAPAPGQIARLNAAWRGVSSRIRRLAGDHDEQPMVELLHDELQELGAAIAAHLPYSELSLLARRFGHERVFVRLQRAAEQARSLARRLGKADPDLEISVEPQLRLPAERWAPFWAAFVHVVRNAMDHGLERVEARRLAGKADAGTLRFSARISSNQLFVELADDGRGIDWEGVRARARDRGLPHALESDLVEALFADGVSTADSVSDVSGRGLGMSAVRETVRALAGSVQIFSETGRGTRICFSFPLSQPVAADPGSRMNAPRPLFEVSEA